MDHATLSTNASYLPYFGSIAAAAAFLTEVLTSFTSLLTYP